MKETVRRALIQGAAVVALTAAAIAPVRANFVYSLDVVGTTVGDFVLTMPSLITSTTTFTLADFDSITAPAGTLSVTFTTPLGPVDAEVDFNLASGSTGFFWFAPFFTGPGTYCSGEGGCDGDEAAIMTITETSNAPEPATLALLSLGIAGLAATRRRKRN